MYVTGRQYRDQQPVQHKRVVRKGLVPALVLLTAGVLLFVFVASHQAHLPPGTHVAQTGVQGASDGFDKHKYSLNDPNSIWVVVNKRQPLIPLDYAPSDLVTPQVPLRLNKNDPEMHIRAPAASALRQMIAAADRQRIHLQLASGYRAYTLQVRVYNAEVYSNGAAEADQQSARPGYSEHQTGLAADLEPTTRQCEIETCFAELPEGKWLIANAYRYGFIMRYPQDKVPITGYTYEPWHIRYVGTALSDEMHRSNIATLEEFFNLGTAPAYGQ